MDEIRSAQEPSGNDAQRKLEQRALRNVRGLVDRMEAEEEAKRRSQKWVVAILIAVFAVLGAVLVKTIGGKTEGAREILVAPESKDRAR